MYNNYKSILTFDLRCRYYSLVVLSDDDLLTFPCNIKTFRHEIFKTNNDTIGFHIKHNV